ncbi:ATP-binding cassette domain-containing protein [Gleimia hominis]|uniref:ATP-binding cassette domain-containing protein n=1 Tax=Gleimia hominis TaxID=595468 RepID=UPI0028AD928D|nr:ATP-binding cassette domain-containing protein [Gleimia hominis]
MGLLEPVSTPEDAIVTARGLTKIYGKGDAAVQALHDVDVQIGRGQFTAIMGPSGSGKSTLMHCLAGLDSINEGHLELDGTTVSKMSQRKLTKLRRDKIGFIFQTFNLIPTLNAKENILLPAKIAKQKVDPKRFNQVVDAVGLRERLTHRPAELSGGQQQRVACARALVSEPAVIFADEPTGNLDSNASAQVLRFLRSAVDEFGQTVVMVTHEPDAAAWADRILFLVDGQVVAQLTQPNRDRVLEALRELGSDDEPEPTAGSTAAQTPASTAAETNAAATNGAGTPNTTGAHSADASNTDVPPTSNAGAPLTSDTDAPPTSDTDAPLPTGTGGRPSSQPGPQARNTLVDAQLPGETLDQTLRRLAPAGELEPEAARVVDAAQEILANLPGSVVPEEEDPVTGSIPVVPRNGKHLNEPQENPVSDTRETEEIRAAGTETNAAGTEEIRAAGTEETNAAGTETNAAGTEEPHATDAEETHTVDTEETQS